MSSSKLRTHRTQELQEKRNSEIKTSKKEMHGRKDTVESTVGKLRDGKKKQRQSNRQKERKKEKGLRRKGKIRRQAKIRW